MLDLDHWRKDRYSTGWLLRCDTGRKGMPGEGNMAFFGQDGPSPDVQGEVCLHIDFASSTDRGLLHMSSIYVSNE